MVERPDYVPLSWTRGPLNRRFWRNPTRVFVWLVVLPFCLAAVAAFKLTTGATVMGALILLFTVISIVQAVIYAPRALRAARAHERG